MTINPLFPCYSFESIVYNNILTFFQEYQNDSLKENMQLGGQVGRLT